MALEVKQVSLEAIRALRPLMSRIQARDKALAQQITRAASSMSLNIAEGEMSDPGNRRARWFSAAGSANETRCALEVAVAWGYLTENQAAAPAAHLDRAVRMLWRLTHPPG